MRIEAKSVLAVLTLACILQVMPAAMAVADCVEPDSAKAAEVVTYLMKKYQLASTTGLVLTSSTRANDSCFWRMEYASTSPRQNYVMYLSPDRRFLSPALYDMALDPLAETRAQDEQLAKSLLVGANPGMGSAAAPVTIVEFSDFECPFCKRMADVLEKEVLPKEGARVNVVFRNFPLPMHPWAKQAAEIAECAALQKPEAFWAMHDYFFQNQGTLKPDNVHDQMIAFAATRKDLDQAQFTSCVDHELGLGPVLQDQQLGDKLGVHGTPSLFVNGVRFDGLRSAAEMRQLIDQAAKGELISSAARSVNATNASIRTAAPPSAGGSAQCAPTTRGGGGANAQ